MNELSNIKEYYYKNNLFFSAEIELTTRCNFRCKHCYLCEKGNDYEMSTNEVFALLDSLRRCGVYEIQFTGGEPFLRDDIFDIIEYARKLYFRVIILSNISLLDTDKIRKMEELGVEIVSTTLFSMNDMSNDKITGGSLTATKIMDNVKLFLKSNINIEIKTILMKENADDYVEISDFCKKNSIKYLATEGLFPDYKLSIKPRNLAMTDEQLFNVIDDIDRIRFGNIYREEKKEDSKICCELHFSLFIRSNGDVYPCSLWYERIGNCLEDDINDIWHSSYLNKIRNTTWKSLQKCNKCEYNKYCIRCSGVVLSASGTYTGCDPFTCRTAKIRKKKTERGV